MTRLKHIFLYSMCSCVVFAQSPYIDKVYDFNPAPGQFVNVIPQYEEGDTYDAMIQKANLAIANNARSMICLGGFGGSITFGFDHDIVNHSGEYDFQVFGNAMLSTNAADGRVGGSSEPGIIYVSADDNGNGLPDDKWYEIAGSEYYKPETKHNFTITYYRTPKSHQPTPSVVNKLLVDTTFILWKDSDGKVGYISKNSYHTQNYFPEWVDADSISFTGTLLADNALWNNTSNMYILYCYDYGYADNYPNTSEHSKINIDWAVDENGQSVQLDNIRFVKIQTGVNQQCGWIGETSTEITDAVDLHFIDAVENESVSTKIVGIYTILGQSINTPLDNLQHGLYIIIYSDGTTRKISR